MRKKNVKLTTSMLLGFVATIWLTGCAKADVAGSVYHRTQIQTNPYKGDRKTGQDEARVESPADSDSAPISLVNL